MSEFFFDFFGVSLYISANCYIPSLTRIISMTDTSKVEGEYSSVLPFFSTVNCLQKPSLARQLPTRTKLFISRCPSPPALPVKICASPSHCGRIARLQHPHHQ